MGTKLIGLSYDFSGPPNSEMLMEDSAQNFTSVVSAPSSRPRACESCSASDETIAISGNYGLLSVPKKAFAVVFIYLPILLMPIVVLMALLAYTHLRLLGATNLRRYREFLPEKGSHRYNLKTQILPRTHFSAVYARTRLYWILNCTMYCPHSVALFEYLSYLTKATENWWCPFAHSKKSTYASARIDGSYWHSTDNMNDLHPDDRSNPLWSVESDEDRSTSGA